MQYTPSLASNEEALHQQAACIYTPYGVRSCCYCVLWQAHKLLGGYNEAADLPRKRHIAQVQRRLALLSIGIFTLYMSLGEYYLVCLVV